MKKCFNSLVCFLMILISLPMGCAKQKDAVLPTPKPSVPREAPLEVLSSIGVIGGTVSVIGGSRVNSSLLVEPGSLPWTYQGKDSDQALLEKADLIFIIGLGLEAGLEPLLAPYRQKVVDLSSALPKERLIPSSSYTSGYDPHYWFDVDLWQEAVTLMTREMFSRDPGYEFGYQSAHIRYGQSMSLLKRYIETWTARIPEARRVFITQNCALNYLAPWTGARVMSLIDPGGTEPVNRDKLVDFIFQNRIPVLLGEFGYPEENLQSLQQLVGKKGGDVQILSGIYTYFFDYSPASGDSHYLNAMRTNMDRLYEAFKGVE